MPVVDVNLPRNPYKIHVECDLIQNIASYVTMYYSGQRISIVTDENVSKIYSRKVVEVLEHAGFMVEVFAVKPGEGSKSFSTYEFVSEKLIESGHTRTDPILALGGGVVGDLAGFIGATLLRGVPVIQVPTSLLAQIDSSVGGKTGINLKAGKNLLGAIHQPIAVLIDPLTLDTLPHKYLRDGIGEAIKYGFINRPDLLDLFEDIATKKAPFKSVLDCRESIIELCCASKRDFVVQDEKDFGQRMILNYGHTIGHAIEKFHNYKGYTHGEAVAMGMYYIQKISEHHGLTQKGLVKRLEVLLKAFDLYQPETKASPDVWIETIAKDKKNLNAKLNVILVEKPGQPIIYETSLDGFYMMMKEGL
ncbi:3-dehydroquinate synthase [Fusibacter sp. JL216-2]|uniref:3-dehydroquinate synthase n=1 Tax=Fusibacter sp. JL216-2 TaxID=3071453 RepID=UPI003D32B1A0